LDGTKNEVPIYEFLRGENRRRRRRRRGRFRINHTHRHVAAQDTGKKAEPSERGREGEGGRDCPIDLVTALARALARLDERRAPGRAFERAAAATSAVTYVTPAAKDPVAGHVDPSEQSFAHMEELLRLREGGRTKHNYFRHNEMYGRGRDTISGLRT